MSAALGTASIGFLATALVVSKSDPPTALKLFTLAISYGGIGMFPGPAVAAAGDILPSSEAALGFGLITTIGTLGGVVGPYFIGLLREVTGNFSLAWGTLACVGLLAALLMLLLKRVSRISQIARESSENGLFGHSSRDSSQNLFDTFENDIEEL